MLLVGTRDQRHHQQQTAPPPREHTDMARGTRIKIAALATTFVAALGIMAVSPATQAQAGNVGPRVGCC
jgi:hypothetical protein